MNTDLQPVEDINKNQSITEKKEHNSAIFEEGKMEEHNDNVSNSKRIAKNTMFLYLRMLLLMAISLYTSRVILNSLGEVDYGVYNVVGGVVAMFSMVSASLSSAISRFLTFELGKGDKNELNKVFSSSVSIQILLSALVIILAESVGLWFVNTQLVIPEDRLFAANVCFQFSILTFVVNLISVPYNAVIIAHEKMSAFAYISILEGVGGLTIAILIDFNPFDKLVFYGLMLCLLALLVRFVYCSYCKRHFEECDYKFIFDFDLLKKMFGFAGWNTIGACSAILRDQGNSIIINLFFGPALNSALAIAQKVNASISSFIQNFLVALNPQITKSYASGNKNYMFSLVFQGSRLSFYMLLLLSMPIIFNANFILDIWLKNVPEHTVVFVQLILILAMSDSLSHTLVTSILANGNIKTYMLVVGGLQLLNLPINVILLYFGMSPYVIYIVAITLSQICLLARLLVLHKMMDLDVFKFAKSVYFNVLGVTLVASILPIISKIYFPYGWISFFVVSIVSLVSVFTVVFFIGCDTTEQDFVKNKIRRFIFK